MMGFFLMAVSHCHVYFLLFLHVGSVGFYYQTYLIICYYYLVLVRE